MKKRFSKKKLKKLAKEMDDPEIITSGSCASEKAQEKFDKEQKGKPPF